MTAPGTVTIAQSLPTRVRLAAPRLAWHGDACARAARVIADAGPSVRVRVRRATGSVIVEGAEGSLAAEPLRDALEAWLRDACDDEGRRLVDLGPGDHPSPTRIARAVAHAAASVNADVRAALDERADLGTLLPLFFALAGVAEIGVTRRMPGPSWFNLLWWSLRSFMTFNLAAVMAEEPPPVSAEAARREAMGEA